MSSTARSPNHVEGLTARSTITGQNEYLKSTNGAININGTIGGSALPISGATTGVGVAILDSSGNQISSFGGGTQYTQGGATVANPTGTAEIWFDSSGNPKAITPSQPLPSNITDGTTAASVEAGDTGYNGVVTANNSKSYAFTTSGAGAQMLGPFNTAGYARISVQFAAATLGSGVAVTGQFSLDGVTNWNNSTKWQNTTNTQNVSQALTSTANLFSAPVEGPFFRLNYTAITSGTSAGIIHVSSSPYVATTSGVAASQSGTWTVGSNSATGSAVPANAFYLAGSLGGNLTGAVMTSAASDGIGTATSIYTAALQYLFNGTNYDRLRSIVNATNSTGTGISAVGLVGQFDDVAPTAITENQFGNLRMSTNRNLYGTIRDAAGNERGVNVNASNQLSISVDNSPVLGAGAALVGKVGIDQTTPGTTNAVVDTPATAGGLSIITGSVGATATVIKGSAGQLYGYHLFNTTAAVAYVQIFNVAAASVTLGTTVPTISIGIPASGGVTVNFDKGIAFGTAISFACTTTRAGLTGATCDVNFYYK